MKPITCFVSVDNPIYEDFAIRRAKHEFIMRNIVLWNDWTLFMPDAPYKERSEEFNKRIVILKTTPVVEVVDGWYKVTSVGLTMQYKGECA
jgi:hypothetical protein